MNYLKIMVIKFHLSLKQLVFPSLLALSDNSMCIIMVYSKTQSLWKYHNFIKNISWLVEFGFFKSIITIVFFV